GWGSSAAANEASATEIAAMAMNGVASFVLRIRGLPARRTVAHTSIAVTRACEAVANGRRTPRQVRCPRDEPSVISRTDHPLSSVDEAGDRQGRGEWRLLADGATVSLPRRCIVQTVNGSLPASVR